MEHDPDVRDEYAAADLGLKPKSYRAAKSKAFAQLKVVLPEVIEEQSIRLSRGAEEAIFRERHEMPSIDPTEAGQDPES